MSATLRGCRRPIAMVAYTYYHTDPRCRREATAAAAAGWPVHFYALARGGRARTHAVDGITLHELPLDRYRGSSTALYLVSYLRFLLLAQGALLIGHLRHRFAVVHVNTMPDFMVLAALWPRLLRARVILDIHDVMPELFMAKFGVPASHWKPALVRRVEVASARMAHVVLTAEHPKAELLAHHGIPPEKISVLLNIPDDSIFDPDSRSPVALLPDDPAAPFRLVYHGTLARRHGLDRALEAVALVAADIPGVRLTIIGEGDHLPELRRMRDELGLADRVEIDGAFKPIEEIVPRLRAAHLAVLPTRAEVSTDYMLPTKLLEYLALGVPAVVSPTRTVRHYFGDSHPLYLEDDSPQGVARKLRQVRGRYAEILAVTEDTRRRFFAEYRWATHKQVYLDLLARLALTGSRTAGSTQPRPRRGRPRAGRPRAPHPERNPGASCHNR
jgi:glycosyltransferase involved in cell wall biosynthesis